MLAPQPIIGEEADLPEYAVTSFSGFVKRKAGREREETFAFDRDLTWSGSGCGMAFASVAAVLAVVSRFASR